MSLRNSKSMTSYNLRRAALHIAGKSSKVLRQLARTALLFVVVSVLPATADIRDQVQANAARGAIIGVLLSEITLPSKSTSRPGC
jgi:hypothetical protein